MTKETGRPEPLEAPALTSCQRLCMIRMQGGQMTDVQAAAAMDLSLEETRKLFVAWCRTPRPDPKAIAVSAAKIVTQVALGLLLETE